MSDRHMKIYSPGSLGQQQEATLSVPVWVTMTYMLVTFDCFENNREHGESRLRTLNVKANASTTSSVSYYSRV